MGERRHVLVPVDALELVLDNVGTDCGPPDAGWKSPELSHAVAELEAAIQDANQPKTDASER